MSRGDATPYTDAVSLIRSSAPQLTAANITITLSIGGRSPPSGAHGPYAQPIAPPGEEAGENRQIEESRRGARGTAVT